MKNWKPRLPIVGFILVLSMVAAAADAPPLTFKFKPASVPGAILTEPIGINNAGMTAGLYQDSGGVIHGYVLKGKAVTRLDDPNGTNTVANNLQYNGTAVVGSYVNSAGTLVGFFSKGGKTPWHFTDITGPAGAVAASANGINDAGDIVGNYSDSSGVTHGFLLKGGKYSTLDVPGAIGTVATEISNQCAIVVYWADSTGAVESSILIGKKYRTINVPGASSSYALGLNNEGDVSYLWLDSAGLIHAALRHERKYYKFGYPDAYETYGGGLNDKDMVAGGYIAAKGGNFAGYTATFK